MTVRGGGRGGGGGGGEASTECGRREKRRRETGFSRRRTVRDIYGNHYRKGRNRDKSYGKRFLVFVFFYKSGALK